LAAPATHAATLTVPDDHATVAEALSAAAAGDRIEIAPGTYREYDLVLPPGVNIVGMGDTPGDVVVDAEGRGRVFLAEGILHATYLRNLTMTGGLATGETSYDRSGGALLVNNSFIQVIGCQFLNNAADAQGGAVRATSSTLIIDDCLFDSNTATDGGGGAIDCSYGSSPLIKNCRFTLNQASWGGAISCRANASPQVINSFFQDNEAVGNRGFGGAVFTDNEALPTFTGSTFHRNKARYGGALACFENSETNLQNCTLVANESSVEGGGLFTNDASPSVACSIIAYQVGKGITAMGNAIPVITDTDLFGNSSGDWVGPIEDVGGTDGNMADDPMFCHLDPGPGEGFTLPPESPCATGTGTCEVIGAWPVDCIITPVTLGTFEAGWHEDQARLSWQLQTTGTHPTFLLTGTNANDPGHEWVVEYQNDGTGAFTGLDPMVNRDDGNQYTFYLYIPNGEGGWDLLGQAHLDALPVFSGIRKLAASPNPFNPMTTVSFELGQAQMARVALYGLDGRRIRDFGQNRYSQGQNELVWDGRDSGGRLAASGPYVVVVDGENQTRTLKVTLLK
jgi:predicted outer membrane repeat protein